MGGDDPKLSQAVHLMTEAKRLLFKRFEDPETLNRELVESIHRLDQAIDFAEHPDTPMTMCPDCGSLVVEELPANYLRCLCCMREWDRTNYLREI